MKAERVKLLEAGLLQLPARPRFGAGRNGETLDTDEAAVWKRVLNYRVAEFIKPTSILETHPGLGVSTSLYRLANPQARVFLSPALVGHRGPCDLVDVDPFGAPWATLEIIRPVIGASSVLFVSNGEAHAVRRNLKRGQAFPTRYSGHRLPYWVLLEYLPRLEAISGLSVQFFYAFPTTVRAVLANRTLSSDLWRGCPSFMWWLTWPPADSRGRYGYLAPADTPPKGQTLNSMD